MYRSYGEKVSDLKVGRVAPDADIAVGLQLTCDPRRTPITWHRNRKCLVARHMTSRRGTAGRQRPANPPTASATRRGDNLS